MLRQLKKHPYSIVFVFLVLYFLYYLGKFNIDYAMFGDMVGRYIQTKDVIEKPFLDFSCNYKYDFDPSYKFIPLEDHFYFFQNKECVHAYPYLYSLLASPFVNWNEKYGFYLLNFLFWILYAFSFMRLSKEMFPNKDYIEIFAGVFSVMILPTGIYQFDYSELNIAISLAGVSLLLSFLSLEFSPFSIRRPLLLFWASLIAGASFIFRPENIIVYSSIILAIFILLIKNSTESNLVKNSLLTLKRGLIFPIIGIILGFIISAVYHKYLFGTLLPARIGSPKSIDPQTLETKLKNIWILLVGGSAGLFTSLPFINLSFLYFWKPIREKLSNIGLFFVLVSFVPMAIIILVTPGWGGYSWSPRYLATLLVPFSCLVFLVVINGMEIFQNKFSSTAIRRIQIALSLLILYSIVFTHIGMGIFVNATKQISKYNEIMDKYPTNTYILSRSTYYTFFSKKRLRNSKIFKAEDNPSLIELLSKIEQTTDSYIYMFYAPQKVDYHLPKELSNQWAVSKQDYFFHINYVYVQKSVLK